MEGRGESAGFFIAPVEINILIGFKVVPQVSFDWLQVNLLKLLLLSFVQCFCRSGRGIDL